jgi:hypothetical protein
MIRPVGLSAVRSRVIQPVRSSWRKDRWTVPMDRPARWAMAASLAQQWSLALAQ